MAAGHREAAAAVRALIGDGTFKPGDELPPIAVLAARIGVHPEACGIALRSLAVAGVLVPGPRGPRAPRRVAGGTADPGVPPMGAALRRWRLGARLTQVQLGALGGMSRNTVSSMESGHRTPPRPFWERADRALGAGGELLRLFDEHAAADGTAPVVP